MTPEATLADHLKAHLKLCEEILLLVIGENRAQQELVALPREEGIQKKRELLRRLTQSSQQLAVFRTAWQRLHADERVLDADITRLMRQNQDLILRIVMLDRENEQVLLRHGLVPVRHLPPANRQRPHFVAELYRRVAVG